MSRKKIEEKDREIADLQKKCERLLEERKADRKDCSILVEENTDKEAEAISHPLLQTRMSLDTIKEESEINTSNLKTEERFVDAVLP